MGVWIETPKCLNLYRVKAVTPFVGVWIETPRRKEAPREGLVTPFVGVWIETVQENYHNQASASHTLRGCVD